MLTENILEIDELNVYYGTRSACQKSFLPWHAETNNGTRIGELSERDAAVSGVSFAVPAGKVVTIIGESGSGKSTTLSAMTGLLPGDATCTGSIRYMGSELLGLGKSGRRHLLGSDIVTIFQNPDRFLDPTFKVGHQIEDYLMYQNGIKRAEARQKSKELLENLSFENPEQVLDSYPFELSGGMCQRVSIAMILGCAKARLILADEPTSALDQIIRYQTADLIKEVQRELDAAMLLVTHDIRLADKMSDLIGVMYKGRLVEWGMAEEILGDPRHLYTKSLIDATPTRDTDFSTFRAYRDNGARLEWHKEKISDTHWIMVNDQQ